MRISVIIPTYNRAALIGATLDSVLSQTRPADEVIVADDGSTDGTAAVVAARAPHALFLRRPQSGPSAARNAGLRASSGEAVVFLDSDDLLLPGALAALEGALAGEPGAALAYCRSQTVDAGGALVDARWDRADFAGEVWGEMVRRNFIRSPGCALVRRSCLEAAGEWDPAFRYSEEWDVWLRLAERWPFARVDAPLFQYRTHAGTLSGSSVRMAQGALWVLDKQTRRHRRDAGRRAAVAASRRRLCDFGMGEVLTEARAGHFQDPRAAGELVRRALRVQPLRTLWQAWRAPRPGWLPTWSLPALLAAVLVGLLLARRRGGRTS